MAFWGRRTLNGNNRSRTGAVTVGSTPSLKLAIANLEDLEGYKGLNILQNAATVGFDKMRDKSIENFSQLTFGRKARAYVKGRRGIATFGETKGGKGKKIRSVRKSLTQRGSYSVEATKTRTGLVARQYINSKHYYNYVSHMIEGGYTPGGGTKYEGSYVKAQPFRRPVGVRYNDRVGKVMQEAIALQLKEGKRIGLGKLRTML